ncbi:B12-binding domain/radical SAM domain-containing protein [Tistrella mobilis]|uniref:B12-binding domain/radical SAM domain-containing protein n=1 Tax=Tistrella mobilis TaxID=171437 RepID=UPI003556BC79
MTLRAVAVSAPDWVAGAKDDRALNSRDAASLYNACRVAAAEAAAGRGAWGASNWAAADPRAARAAARASTLLMYSMDDMPAFRALIERQRPNLLLIGAMSLCLPGAVACAREAREILGDRVAIVLGGRHASETVWLPDRSDRRAATLGRHAGAPLELIHAGRLPAVFDAVAMGDGEYLIAALGRAVEAAVRRGLHPAALFHEIDPATPGDWILGLDDRGRPGYLVSRGVAMNQMALPSPARTFGVSASFGVFGGRMTAHVFSDIGRGCVYDCNFCSERVSATGGVRDLANSADRLHGQLAAACRTIAEDWPGRRASAFCEDSVLLGGATRLIDRFCDLMDRQPLDIRFGGQLTIDQILTRPAEVARLARAGLSYVFIGVETLSPEEIGGMSKDVGRKRASWTDRMHRAFDVLGEAGIDCGCAVLFGLGERHESRLALLDTLDRFRLSHGAPDPISLNWAVQHPLCGEDGGAGYDYVDWGTPEGPYLDLFHNFGEASLRYPLPQVGAPRLAEVAEVVAAADAVRGRPLGGRLAS